MSTVIMAHLSPGSEAEQESSLRGMERGFALSPMADLVRAYNSSSDSELSLFQRVMMLASKASFDISDILDQGVIAESSSTKYELACFSLETGFLLRTERTLKEMQDTLSQAASLVVGQNSCFHIDPYRILITVLYIANSLGELQASWSTLAEHLNLVHRNFEKYQSEFQASSEEEYPLSLVSTQPELYSVFPRDATPAANIDYFYVEIPHHKKQRPKGYSPHTDMVHDHLEIPGYLKHAFPDRLPETHPSTVYYSAEGERRENVFPESTSYRNVSNFAMPARTDKGINCEWSRTPPPTVEEVEDEDDIRAKAKRKEHQPVASRLSSGILSSDIPFKSSQQFFVPWLGNSDVGPTLSETLRQRYLLEQHEIELKEDSGIIRTIVVGSLRRVHYQAKRILLLTIDMVRGNSKWITYLRSVEGKSLTPKRTLRMIAKVATQRITVVLHFRRW
ncbi:hypothetical protein K438DRAFT_1750659 [Mycena galopus ATCC 62051]|nr:hypothetical protein K438DRAFT_1750659 [Mycena galopus ATCC 62051]